MKETQAITDYSPRRPIRGLLKASYREIDKDYELLGVPLCQRNLITKRLAKKLKKGNRQGNACKPLQFSRDLEGLVAILGFSTFILKGVDEGTEKEAVVPKRILGRGATHVAIAQYIKYQQLQVETPSTTA